jgi:hypothetical protein
MYLNRGHRAGTVPAIMMTSIYEGKSITVEGKYLNPEPNVIVEMLTSALYTYVRIATLRCQNGSSLRVPQRYSGPVPGDVRMLVEVFE